MGYSLKHTITEAQNRANEINTVVYIMRKENGRKFYIVLQEEIFKYDILIKTVEPNGRLERG